jgi:Spy/CpxP family protein refolding chaperone
MINRFTQFCLMSAFGVSLVCAQGRGTPPSPADMVQHRVSMLTDQLSLTAAQQDQAKTIYTNASTAEAALRDSMRTARQALNDAVKSNNPAGITAAAATIGNLTAQSTEISAKADASLYQILTVDQRANFHTGGPGMGGPGGPGGFGRGGASPRNRPGPPPNN